MVSETLLTTKIHIPAVHSNLVRRPHLIRQLNDGIAHNCRLTLISAPAGYGKSTLLSEWVSQLNLPAAWLSLEQADNAPIRFWSYFFTALSSFPHLGDSGFFESLIRRLQSQHPPPIAQLLAHFVNQICKPAEQAVLVLDDLHTIADHQIHQELIYLTDHLPSSASCLHLVVASRMDPPWPLARWRVRAELNELRPADLRFSYDETAHFLNQSLEHELSFQDIVALRDRTEGWIAGLQMAAVSMRGRLKAQDYAGVSRFIENFTGSNRFVLDYLMEEVIRQQPELLRDFLLGTSIVERLTAPLCDALLGRQDGQAALDQVEQANLFLIPLDDERTWYRYHHLFAELLRKCLKQIMPNQIHELHRRASEWYAENKFLSEAISHAMAAEDFLRVNDLVSGNALAMMEHAELSALLRRFEQIPNRQIASKPWLGAAYAWTVAYVKPSADIERILQQVEQGSGAEENIVEIQHLASHLAAIRAYVAWVQGDADEALVLARNALQNLPEDDWMARSHILNIEGLARQYQSDLPGAVQSFEAALAAGQKTGIVYETFHACTNLAFVFLLQGHLHRAFSLCQHVLDLADQPGLIGLRMPVLSYAYATMSLVQLERNALEAAVLSARQGVAMAEQWNQADTLHFALSCLSRVLCATGEIEEAFATNQRAMQLGLAVSPWFYRLSVLDEIELDIVNGDITAAAQRLEQIEPLVEDSTKKGVFLVTEAALLNAQKRYSDVLMTLQEPVGELERRGHHLHLINLLPYQALAYQALGREDEALKVIGRCLELAAPEGFVRIFVERGAPMLKLLQAALSQGIQTEYLNRLLASFEIPTGPRKSGSPILTSAPPLFEDKDLRQPLSERELEVLRFLNTHLSIPEIAEELVVASSTIRTHVRNIYTKLDVHGRIEAIQKAKDFRLI